MLQKPFEGSWKPPLQPRPFNPLGLGPFESILSSAISVLSPDVKLVGALTRQAAEISQKAFAESVQPKSA